MFRLAFALVFAVGCKTKRVDDSPKRTAPADASHRYGEADVAGARYHSGDEIVEAGAAALGAIAVIRISRAEVRAEDFTAYPCEPSDHPHKYFLTISPDSRDYIRAMPTRSADCPRVLVRVGSVGASGVSGYRAEGGTWKTRADSEKLIVAETLAILDVQPRPSTPGPAGAKFATLDDIVIGPFRAGDLAELPMRAHVLAGGARVYMRPCIGLDEDVVFPDEKPDGALARTDTCRMIRFRLRDRRSPGLAGQTIEADLVSIGDTIP